MCGIVGVASSGGGIHHRLLERQRDALSHRGPDDCGVWWSTDGTVGLGHRRLSIIDLSSAGHQPMADASGSLHVVLNGEIYNYRELRREIAMTGVKFRTESDTEVLLEAYRKWGTQCLERLNGMFAFALVDVARARVFAARDRAGEKPFFYRHRGGVFTFASELKSLLIDDRVKPILNLEALDAYLAYGFVPSELCIVRDISKLPPAHALTYDLRADKVDTWRYWDLPAETSAEDVSGEFLTDRFEELLEAAVSRQLVADVPVGVLLSGGVDSSLITAMAARVASGELKTFTVSFPGHDSHDESLYAAQVARHFGTEHFNLTAEPATVELLPKLARQYDEPLADSSMVPTYLLSRLVREHAKVALGGDGGDELFAGYPHYRWLERQRRVRRFAPRQMRVLASAVGRRLPLGTKGRNQLIGAETDVSGSIAHINLYFDRLTRARLAPLLRSRSGAVAEASKLRLASAEGSALWTATAVDFKLYLPDDLLVKVDRASMLSSLEVRAPFLDPDLVNFAFGEVPANMKASPTASKILPRILARKLLPASLDLDRKQGFSLPLAAWFKGTWGAYMEAVLRDAPAELFDPSVVRSLFDGQRRGYSNTHRIFALTIFELWRREYNVVLPS